jgi:hypothetical protein
MNKRHTAKNSDKILRQIGFWFPVPEGFHDDSEHT